MINLHVIQDLVFILCAAFGELREPDLPAVPLMEQLQPLHHLVGLAAVVVSGEVVNPAAQGLARLQGRIQGDFQFWFYLEFQTSKNGSNQFVFPAAGAGLTRVCSCNRSSDCTLGNQGVTADISINPVEKKSLLLLSFFQL